MWPGIGRTRKPLLCGTRRQIRPDSTCDRQFGPNSAIVDQTFCGDLAKVGSESTQFAPTKSSGIDSQWPGIRETNPESARIAPDSTKVAPRPCDLISVEFDLICSKLNPKLVRFRPHLAEFRPHPRQLGRRGDHLSGTFAEQRGVHSDAQTEGCGGSPLGIHPNREIAFRVRVVRDTRTKLSASHPGGGVRWTCVLQVLRPPARPRRCPGGGHGARPWPRCCVGHKNDNVGTILPSFPDPDGTPSPMCKVVNLDIRPGRLRKRGCWFGLVSLSGKL